MSGASAAPPANWYPDPTGRHQLRYWDGAQWTEHVSTGGATAVDPLTPQPVPAAQRDADKHQRQLERAGVVAGQAQGGGTLFTEPVLVVNQKAKLIEVSNEYAVYDQHGTQIAAVRQVGQSALKKAARVLTSLDQFMTHSLQIVDMTGAVQLTITRPAKVLKSRFVVGDAAGREIGQIVQRNVFGKIRFGFEVDGHEIGTLSAQNWRAWNFSIADAAGAEVAKVTKTWEGLAKTLFTTADNYVLTLERPLDEPLRSFVIASALSIDTALKQDNRGFN